MKASSEKPNITAQKSAITPIQTVTCTQKENMCGTFKQSSLDFLFDIRDDESFTECFALQSLSSNCTRPPSNCGCVEVVAGVWLRDVLIAMILQAMWFHKMLPSVEVDCGYRHTA